MKPTCHPSLELFSSSPTETSYSLKKTSPFSLPLVPGNRHSKEGSLLSRGRRRVFLSGLHWSRQFYETSSNHSNATMSPSLVQFCLLCACSSELEKETETHSSSLAWRTPMDRGAGWAAVHGVTQSWTWPSGWAAILESCPICQGYTPWHSGLDDNS